MAEISGARMMALNYLVDTHVLHWHLEIPIKLPVRVRDIFAKASRGEVRLIISHICDAGAVLSL